jgi:hypothetical protein
MKLTHHLVGFGGLLVSASVPNGNGKNKKKEGELYFLAKFASTQQGKFTMGFLPRGLNCVDPHVP